MDSIGTLNESNTGGRMATVILSIYGLATDSRRYDRKYIASTLSSSITEASNSAVYLSARAIVCSS